MVAKRAFFVGVLVVTASILGACGSGSGAEPMVTVTPTPVPGSPTASPSPTPAPAAPASAPVMPELAKQNTPEGAAAFTAYWFELFNWSVSSNEVTDLRERSGPDCEFCGNVIAKLSHAAEENSRLEGGGATASDVQFSHEFSDGTLVFDLVYSEKAGKQILPDGSIQHEWADVAPVDRQVVVGWKDGKGWAMDGFGVRIDCADCEY